MVEIKNSYFSLFWGKSKVLGNFLHFVDLIFTKMYNKACNCYPVILVGNSKSPCNINTISLPAETYSEPVYWLFPQKKMIFDWVCFTQFWMQLCFWTASERYIITVSNNIHCFYVGTLTVTNSNFGNRYMGPIH